MPRFLDRTGRRYGRLIVTEHKGKDGRGKHLWLCKCDCGNSKVVVADNLSSNKSKSCGCLKIEFLAKKGNQFGLYENRELALLKKEYSHLKRRHTQRKMEGLILSFEVFMWKVKTPCRYCGLEHSKEIEDRLNDSSSKKRLSDYILKINGLDRVDNAAGYTEDNAVPCCKYCNFAKHTMSESDFYKWLERAYNHSFRKVLKGELKK